MIEDTRTLVYVPVCKTLQVLLNRDDVFEQLVFDDGTFAGQYRSFRDGECFKTNISLGAYIDDVEICNPLGTSKKDPQNNGSVLGGT